MLITTNLGRNCRCS